MKPASAALAAMALFSTAAGAYPSMIRHGYTQCAACHTDPSGGTLLTKYGRAQSELLRDDTGKVRSRQEHRSENRVH